MLFRAYYLRFFSINFQYDDDTLNEILLLGGCKMLPQEPYKRFAVITLYVFVGIAAAFLLYYYLWGAVLPFLIAYIFAECFRPVVRYSESHKTFPKRSFVLFVILLAAVSIAFLIYGIARQVFLEISALAKQAGDAITLIRTDDAYAESIFNKINSLVPFVDVRERLWEMRDDLDEEIWSMTLSIAERISGELISFIGNAVSFLPNALLAFAVVIIATYYFAIDRVRVNCFFLSMFPKGIRPMLKTLKDEFANTVGRYLRAYGLLFIITFTELLVAFLILGINYAFVLALVIAIVDILPVLGTGTVLIPWGIIALSSGNYGMGIGILVTYAVITVVRQILEPKIVGKFIGLPPLAALAAMYIGLKLMGIAGLFLFPIIAILAVRIIETKKDGV